MAESSSTAVDIFASLPPELVAEILTLLSSEDVVNCLHVSRTWRGLIASFRSLWTRSCLDYGLPNYHYHLHEEVVDPVELYLAARRQRRHIAASKHRVYADIRPADLRDEDGYGAALERSHQILYAGSGIVVAMLFRRREVATEKETGPTADSGGASSGGNPLQFTTYNTLKQRYEFGYILIERLNATTGCTEEICRVALEDKWKWPILTQGFAATDQSWVVLRVKETWIETAWYKIMLPSSKGGKGHRDSLPSAELRLPDFSSMHHPSTPYFTDCCSECSTVALVKNKLSMRPPWECDIDMLSISATGVDQQLKQHTIPILNYDQMRLSSDVHANVVFRPTLFCERSSDAGLCASHKLILWRTNDHTITLYDCSTEEEGILIKPVATFTPVPQGKSLELSTAWGHAKLKLSADRTLLGFLMARRLHLWSLHTHTKLRTVHLEGIPGLRSWMLALGHVYSLFGTLHEEGEMVLVSTHTGQVVWRCESLHRPPIPGRTASFKALNGVVHEDWLSDVHRQCPINTPFLLYTYIYLQSEAVAMSGLTFS